MATVEVKCPYCGSEEVIFFGYSRSGKRRCKCQNEECSHVTFQLEYSYKACEPGVSEAIVKMAMNAAGTRDTARILGIDKDTVTRHLRNLGGFVENTNTSFLENMQEGSQVDIIIVNPLDAGSNEEKTEQNGCSGIGVEMDEQWSWYGNKHNQDWLWWAVDHATNTPLTFCFGTREHCNLDVLLSQLEPFNVQICYTDHNFAYSSRIPEHKLLMGKRNTQQIERDHLTLRTRIKRLARKTICFSKKKEIHEAVIGAFINIYWFGREYVA